MKFIKKAINRILGYDLPAWLIGVLVAVFLLRLPSLFEPYAYGDEMIYLTLGQAIRKGLTLYQDIHDNKPPLLYLAAGLAGNLFWFKALLAGWVIGATVIFWELTQLVFKNNWSQKVATIIFALLTTLPLLEGNVVNAELFMIGPILLAFLILLAQKLKPKCIFIAGVLFGLATLFKVPAAFDLPAIIVFWLIISKLNSQNLRQIFSRATILTLGFMIPIGLVLGWYLAKGVLAEFFVATLGQNIGYLSSFRPGDVQKPFLIRNLPLLIRAGLVTLGLLVTFKLRRKLSTTFILATVWLLFNLFAITLSERPYPHYLIQAVPAISILGAILITGKTKEQVYTLVPLAVAFFVPVYFNFWHYPTLPYYNRFLEFATGRINREEYFARFDGQVNRNYKITEFLLAATDPQDKIFVWGDSPPIYALSRRLPPTKYVADYHIQDFTTTQAVLESLEKNPPSYIIVLPNSPAFPQLTRFLQKNYFILSQVENAEIWKQLVY